MSRFTQNLVLALCGAVTSVIIAAILAFVELQWGWALYSYTLWVIIPVGAGLAGFAAASGYYFGSRLLNFRPGRDLLVGITAISAGTFFFIYWLEYVFMTVDGKQVSDAISYSEFLNFMVTHTALSFGYRGHFFGGGVDIGAGGGYLFAALQILGFAVGGYCIYMYLVGLPYCKDCGRYFKDKAMQIRYFDDTDTVAASTEAFLLKVREERFQESIQTHAATGSTKPTGSSMFKSSIELQRCKGCEKRYLKFGVMRWVNKEWKEIADFGYSTYIMERVEIVKNLNP
jgi:hypothetical protein